MHTFQAPAGELSSSATWVAGFIAKNPSVPILAGMKIESVNPNTLTISCSSGDIDAMVTIAGQGSLPATVVPGHRFAELLSALKGETITLKLQGASTMLEVGAKRGSGRVNTLALREYPATINDKLGRCVVVDSRAALHLVQAVSPFTSNAPDWSIGVSITGTGEALVAMAGSRYAMAKSTLSVHTGKFHAHLDPKALIPALKGMSGDVEIGMSEGVVSISCESMDREVRIRKFGTSLPAAAGNLFALPPEASVVFEVEEMASAVRLASIASDWVSLSWDSDGDPIMSVYTGEVGEGREYLGDATTALDVTDITGQLNTSVAASYLMSALKAISTTTATLTKAKRGMLTFRDGVTETVVMPRLAGAK